MKFNESDELDRALKALDNRARRSMLGKLLAGPAVVGELNDLFSMSAPAVSRHLRIMEAAGLIERTRKGAFHAIALNLSPLEPVKEFIQALDSATPTTPDPAVQPSGKRAGSKRKREPRPLSNPTADSTEQPKVWDPEEDEIAKLL